MKPAEFSQLWNQQSTSYPSPQCLIDQIQVQKPIQVVVTDQMPDHTRLGKEWWVTACVPRLMPKIILGVLLLCTLDIKMAHLIVIFKLQH